MHAELVGRQIEITRETIEDVLNYLRVEAPELLVEEIYEENRGRIMEAVAESFAEVGNGRSTFTSGFVFSKLVNVGVIKMFKFPDDLGVSGGIAGKITSLASGSKLLLGAEKYSQLVFIILNSSTNFEVRKKIGAMSFDGNPVQLLLPLFWRLCEIDVSAKDRLLASLKDHPVINMSSSPKLLENYCFNWGCVQFARLWLECPQSSSEQRQSLEDDMMENVLKILRGYLRGWLLS